MLNENELTILRHNKRPTYEKLICRVLENTTLTNIPSHNSVDDINTSVVNVHPNESDLIMLNYCLVTGQSSPLTQDQNIASNQDITLQSEIQHLMQLVHDIYADLSLGSVPDHSRISSATPPPSSSAQTTKGKEVLANSGHEKMIFNSETHNIPSKAHHSSKEDATKTSPGRKSHVGAPKDRLDRFSPTIFFSIALQTVLTDLSRAWPYIRHVNASSSFVTF